MHVDDVRVSGWWPLQHHDPSFPLSSRAAMGAVRVTAVEDDVDTDPSKKTYGNIVGGLLWEEIPGARSGMHAWWLSGPGVVSSGGARAKDDGGTRTRDPLVDFGGGDLLDDTPGGTGFDAPEAFGELPGQRTAKTSSSKWHPIRRGGGVPDARFPAKKPARPAFAKELVFPNGWTAQVSAGTEEDAQEETLHPDAWGAIAVNAGGDPACGSLLYDLDDSGAISRSARYQTAWSVVRMPGVPGAVAVDPALRAGLAQDSIAWQLGRGGRLDGGTGTYRKPGYGLVADYDAGEVGFAAASHGGPWTLGNSADIGGCTKHDFWGETEDGYAIRPVHNSVDALFIMDSERDGRLAFESVPYLPATDLPVIVHAHLRFREATQQWQVQASSVFFNEGPPPITDPPPGGSKPRRDPPPFFPPPPGGSRAQPPEEEEEEPRTGLTETSDGTYVYVWDASGNLVEQRRVKGGVLTKPGDALIPVTENAADGPAETAEPKPGVMPIIGGENGKPTNPASANFIQVPGLIVRATATAAGQIDPTGAAAQTPESLAAFALAPQVGQWLGVASGGGTWESFNTYEVGSSRGYPKAPGAIALVPPDVTPHQLASGTATTRSGGVQLAFPQGLSAVAFGTPLESTGGKVAGGVQIQSNGAGTVAAHLTDSVGVAGHGQETTLSAEDTDLGGGNTLEERHVAQETVNAAGTALGPGFYTSYYGVVDSGGAVLASDSLGVVKVDTLSVVSPTGGRSKFTVDFIDPDGYGVTCVAARPTELDASMPGFWANSHATAASRRPKWWDGSTSRDILLDGDVTGGVTDHGALTGLSDDDHTQYALVTGTRAFTGGITIGGANVPIVASGTGLSNIQRTGAVTAAVHDVLLLQASTSGTAAAGFGVGLAMWGEVASGAEIQIGSLDVVLTDASPSTDAAFAVRLIRAGSEVEAARVTSEGILSLTNAGDFVATISPSALTASQAFTLPDYTGNALKVLRVNAGETDVELVTGATVVTTTRGDLIYRNATVDARLPLGLNGRVLGSDGLDPVWRSLSVAFDEGLSNTPGSLLRRDALTWVGVGPPTSGQALLYDPITYFSWQTLPPATQIRETSGPTDLDVADIPDGTILGRVGGEVVGITTASLGVGGGTVAINRGAASNSRTATLPAGILSANGQMVIFGARGAANTTITATFGGESVTIALPSNSEATRWEIRGEIVRLTAGTAEVWTTVLWNGDDAGAGSPKEVGPSGRQVLTFSGLDFDADDLDLVIAQTSGVEQVRISGGEGGGGSSSSGAASTDVLDNIGLPTYLANYDASDADSLTTTTGLVDTWEDRTGHGYDLTGTTTTRPALVAGGIGGRDAIEFDGVDDFLKVATNPIMTAAFGELWMVVQFSSIAVVHGLWSCADDASTSRYVAGFVDTTTPVMGQRNNDTADFLPSAGAIALDTPHILRWRSNGSAYLIEIDGVDSGLLAPGSGANTGDWAADTAGLDSFTVGRWLPGFGSYFLNGLIGEVIVLDGQNIDVTQALILRRKLASKWGVTL